MRFRSLSILCLLFLFFFASCSSVNHQNEAESVYESQLYASLGESFDYYYSMGLWDFQQITEFVSLLDSDSSKERPYIIGRIDAVLNYNEYYLSLLRSGQSQLETKILPEDFILKLNTFNVAKRDYLALLSSALLNSTFTLNSEFLSGHALLSDILKELNLKISEFDEEERAQYVQQLDEAIALISELSNALE